MKLIESILPETSIQSAIEQLQTLQVDEVTVEPVKVYKTAKQPTMVYRGCAYKENFVHESKLHFLVSDEDAARAEKIVAGAAHA